MKIILMLCSCALLIACGSIQSKQPIIAIPPADKTQLFLQFPEEQDIMFFGKADVDVKNEGAGGGILYPGGLAGFIAGIAAHAAVQAGVNSAQEKQKIALANKVLDKHQSILSTITAQTIFSDNISFTVKDQKIDVYNLKDNPSDKNIFLAHVKPVFYLTQNEKSLILINEITFSEALKSATLSPALIVQYISSPKKITATEDYWTADDYANLKRIIRESFIASIELGLKKNMGLINTKALNQKTIRYSENGKKKVERGHVINSTCERIIFQTLRGAIKSVPVHAKNKKCNIAPKQSGSST